MSTMQIPSNPHYGNGNYIRSFEIRQTGSQSYAFAMEDSYHAFQVHFSHNGTHVTQIDSHWERQPMSSCGGASKALENMVGCPLRAGIYDAAQYQNSRLHCTHQFDMLSLALVHAFHRREDRRYDVVIPDEISGQVQPTLYINNELKLRLTLRDYQYIIEPNHYHGISLMGGFTAWARDNLDDDEREYSFIIQKAMFVAAGQQMDMPTMIGKPAPLSGPVEGTCFASNQENYQTSVRLDTIRNLNSCTPEDMLLFFNPDKNSTK